MSIRARRTDVEPAASGPENGAAESRPARPLDHRPGTVSREAKPPARSGEHAVQALGAAAILFEKLDQDLRATSRRKAEATPAPSARDRIAAAEGRLDTARTQVLLALREVLAAGEGASSRH